MADLTTDNEKQQLLDLSPSVSAIKVYRKRWLMLFLFSMSNMTNGVIFVGLSPVNHVVASYYGVSSIIIEWLSTMFMVFYVIVALPSAYLMEKYGARPILVAVSGLHVVATSLHLCGFGKHFFVFVFVGQVFAAIAFGMVLQVPAKLSVTWYPENERATATSIGVFMNIVGVAIGYLQTTQMIPETSDAHKLGNGLEEFFLSQLIFCLIVFVLTFFLYTEEPPTPSSKVQNSESVMPFSQTLQILVHDKYFVLTCQSYALYYALFVTLSVLLSPLMISKFPSGFESKIGWMGFSYDLLTIPSCFMIGLLLDRFHCYRAVAVFLTVSSTVMWGAFLLLFSKTENFSALFVTVCALGVVGIPYFATGIEQAAEMTYPVPEGTSSAILLIFGNLYGFLMTLGFGILIENGCVEIVAYSILGFYSLSAILACFAKTDLKRKNAEDCSTM